MQFTQEKPDYAPISIKLSTKKEAQALLSLMNLLGRMGDDNRKNFSCSELDVIKDLKDGLSIRLEKP